MRRWALAVLLTALAWYNVVLATAVRAVSEKRDDNSITKPFQRRALHSVGVIGKYLYIEGGETSGYIDGQRTGKSDSYVLNHTLSIRLDQSWSLASVKYTEIQEHKPPPVNKFFMWSDTKSDVLYRYGGAVGYGVDLSLDSDINSALWKFTPDNQGAGSWTTETPSNQDVFNAMVLNTRGAAAFCPGDQLGFVVGGYGTSSTDKRFKGVDWPTSVNTPGMLRYDAKTQIWSNESTTAMSPKGVFTTGEALCVSGFVNNSLLFVIGGYTSGLNDFTNITFYDTKEKKWYWQATTGTIPRGRELFCAVGATSRNATYEIFIHGGRNQADGSFSDTYVLTIPGFHWINTGLSGSNRIDHTCTVVGNRQMLISGGIPLEWDWKPTDPWVSALGIVDMTSLQWSDSYDAKAAEYDSPQKIKDWYNNGNLASVSWSTPEVKELFSQRKGPSPGSPTAPSPTPPIAEQPSPGASPTPVGAIAGGSIGGVVVLAVIGLWFWRRKRKERKQPTEEVNDEGGHERGPTGAELHGQSKPQELPAKSYNSAVYEMPG
ncbi:kelch repeat protein [Pochonia chlamydosporia 170]|uniref:Kelch repeat protein n=1 Tax=Pochonia chlamydosporia 170 TaxID=1380566 RepID=A0A179F8V7_METCM|nr:kelch repeat protein [Pochonia chlamydosporia 170]OAQ61711.1 kelch repeat protein [Pochonia chlamydosporia 170]